MQELPPCRSWCRCSSGRKQFAYELTSKGYVLIICCRYQRHPANRGHSISGCARWQPHGRSRSHPAPLGSYTYRRDCCPRPPRLAPAPPACRLPLPLAISLRCAALQCPLPSPPVPCRGAWQLRQHQHRKPHATLPGFEFGASGLWAMAAIQSDLLLWHSP